jgi:hypothetical protein
MYQRKRQTEGDGEDGQGFVQGLIGAVSVILGVKGKPKWQ